MKSNRTVACAAVVVLSGLAIGAEGVFADAEADASIVRGLAREVIQNSPAVGGIQNRAPIDRSGLVPTDRRYEILSNYVSPAFFARASDGEIESLAALATSDAYNDAPPPAWCYAPGTDPEFVNAMEAIIHDVNPIAFQQIGRWDGTALSPASTAQGEPAIVTYSFIPDGTNIPSEDFGLPGGSSALFAWLDGIYGDTETWQDLFHETFEEWGELIGVTYVYEPNDDGTPTSGLPGQVGVRGDVRIGAYPFSSNNNGGTLAYNNFPQNGDMIFDAFDNFFDNVSSNSRRLRNTIAHEHGHGLGMLHVCPADGTKLMEPAIDTGFAGPQIDDILNGQRHYGDVFEPNDSLATAAPLATIGGEFELTAPFVSIDDNSDSDFYRLDVLVPSEVTVRIAPAAAAYSQGPQSFFCFSGSFTDYNVVHDLRLTVLGPTGATLASVDDTGLGGAEELTHSITTPGAYTVAVEGGSANSIQLYGFTVSATPTGPVPCNGADLVAPIGELDIADVVEFLRAFGDGQPSVDYAAPFGEFDISDVVEFLRLFGAGCP